MNDFKGQLDALDLLAGMEMIDVEREKIAGLSEEEKAKKMRQMAGKISNLAQDLDCAHDESGQMRNDQKKLQDQLKYMLDHEKDKDMQTHVANGGKLKDVPKVKSAEKKSTSSVKAKEPSPFGSAKRKEFSHKVENIPTVLPRSPKKPGLPDRKPGLPERKLGLPERPKVSRSRDASKDSKQPASKPTTPRQEANRATAFVSPRTGSKSPRTGIKSPRGVVLEKKAAVGKAATASLGDVNVK